MKTFSVIVPAYNEEAYITLTLQAIRSSIAALDSGKAEVEIVVVDHMSTDNTLRCSYKADKIIQLARGCSIGAVRNFGARNSNGHVLIFIDADTLVPLEFMKTLVDLVTEGVVGGAVSGKYVPQKWILRLYARFWDWHASRSAIPMTQGVCQYVLREIFDQLGGYDESLYFAEDTDFYWRLYNFTLQQRLRLAIPKSMFVLPSTRRMDKPADVKISIEVKETLAQLVRRLDRTLKEFIVINKLKEL
jgi:glycosyltransferase involved in cell wall biosynthesis